MSFTDEYEKYLAAKYSKDPKPTQPFTTVTIMSETPKDLDFINLNDIQSGPALIPAAEYHVKIVDGKLKENKAKDGYYFSYRVVIQSGEHAGDSVFGMWSLKETVLWKIKKDFKAMGYNPPEGRPKIEDLIGFEGIAKVGLKLKMGEAERDVPEDQKEKENFIDKWIAPIA